MPDRKPLLPEQVLSSLNHSVREKSHVLDISGKVGPGQVRAGRWRSACSEVALDALSQAAGLEHWGGNDRVDRHTGTDCRGVYTTHSIFISGLAQQVFNSSLPGSGLLLPSSPTLLHHKVSFFSDSMPILSVMPKEEQFDAVWGWGG